MNNGQVFTKTENGLLVPGHAAGDERAIAQLLRNYDPELRLVPQQNGYRVYRYAGSDRPAEFLLFWGDQNGPYPLSSAIVDEVRKLDKNNNWNRKYQSPESLNASQRLANAKALSDATQDLIDDWKSVQGRSVTLRANTWGQKRSREAMRKRGWIR